MDLFGNVAVEFVDENKYKIYEVTDELVEKANHHLGLIFKNNYMYKDLPDDEKDKIREQVFELLPYGLGVRVSFSDFTGLYEEMKRVKMIEEVKKGYPIFDTYMDLYYDCRVMEVKGKKKLMRIVYHDDGLEVDEDGGRHFSYEDYDFDEWDEMPGLDYDYHEYNINRKKVEVKKQLVRR